MESKDSASVLGRYDEEGSLVVVYEAGGKTFHARLRPEENREVLTLVRLAEVEDEDSEEVVELHGISHVPPVVREAVQRPVQVVEAVSPRGGFTGP